MVEPISATLAGIALVQKSVDFIKSNIQTAQDIGQFVGAIDDAFNGEKQCIKNREGKDQFATENIAQEIIDAKLAREHLNEMKNLINLRFGHGTWDEILTERKRRIDAQKQAIKEAKAKKMKQQKEILEIVKYSGIGIVCVIFVVLVIYIMSIMNANGARAIEIWGKDEVEKVDPCVDYMTDVFVCLNEGPDAVSKNWHWVACPLEKQQPMELDSAPEGTFLKASKVCIYKDKTILLAKNCPKLISCNK